MKNLFFLLFIVGCSHGGPSGSPREGKTIYSYNDISGNYRMSREFKNIKQKIVTRNQLMDRNGGDSRVVEKSIVVSRLGSVKAKQGRLVTLRPEASEFSVWLEGKQYMSRMRLNPKKRSMTVTMDSPDARWKGTKDISFPKGQFFCFYSQIPECLYHNYLLKRAYDDKSKKLDFYIVWDGYPYIQDQLTRVGKNLFAPATVKFDGEIKKNFRYIVEVEGQMLLYMFSSNYDFVRMSWIVQGITITPPGEDNSDAE